MFPLDSSSVTGRPSSRLPHVIFRCSHTDLFVFMRLPQFSNNFTSHVERGPGSLSVRTDSGKRAPSSISLVPELVWFAISVSTAFAGALRTATLAVLQCLDSRGWISHSESLFRV